MDQNDTEKKEYSGFPRKIKIGLQRETHTGLTLFTIDEVSVPFHKIFDPASICARF